MPATMFQRTGGQAEVFQAAADSSPGQELRRGDPEGKDQAAVGAAVAQEEKASLRVRQPGD